MMLKINKKLSLLSVILSLLILLCAVFPALKTEVLAANDNILLDKTPIVYGSANSEEFVLNDSKVRYEKYGADKMMNGYDTENLENKEFWNSYTKKFTDADTGSGLIVRPQRTAEADRVIVVYRTVSYNINKISISFSETTKKNFSVYASDKYNMLFSEKPVYKIKEDRAKTFEQEINSENVLYIAFVFENPNWTINDISVFGTKTEDNSKNILKSLTPMVYSVSDSANPGYVSGEIFYGTNESDKKAGYSNELVENKSFWNGYTEKLTDENAASGLYIKPQKTSNVDSVILVYELDREYGLSRLTINSPDADTKNIDVYLSSGYGNIFTKNPAIKISENSVCIEEPLEKSKTKYIALVLKDASYTINEISFFGDEYEDTDLGESLIKDKTPEMYASSNNSAFTWNWKQTYYGTESHQKNYGYYENDLRFKEFWDDYTKLLTDGDENTKLYMSPERYKYNDNKIVIVYNLGEYVVKGFKIVADSCDKSISVYASTGRDSLFTGNPIYSTVNDNSEIISDDGNIEKRANYVGIVIENPAYSVNEIYIYGSPYVRPDYGTNLVENNEPIALFVADRSYPIVANYTEILKAAQTNANIGLLCDNNFSTYTQWTPWYSSSTISSSSPYIVFAFDLNSVCEVNKVLIDSSLGGVDIFMADEYTELFKSLDNRVYSTGGDKMILGSTAFDSSTDLDVGENLFEIDNKKGRFIGFVITRTAGCGVVNNGTATINEVQVFGTAEPYDYGENILDGKTPIMAYRADFKDYTTSLGTLQALPDGPEPITDGIYGDTEQQAYYNMPDLSGKPAYDMGVCVIIYYLEGTADIKRIKWTGGGYYYGLGGIEAYSAQNFADLFNPESCIYDSKGATATENVFDPAYDLNAMSVRMYPENATGRYLAFVVTRASASGVKGWGMVRIKEIEVYGTLHNKEQLPNTIVTDDTTGSTAEFIYTNPDDKFEFAKIGISSFKMIPQEQLMTDRVYQDLATNGLKDLTNPFKLVFYDKSGNEISESELEDKRIELNIVLKDDSVQLLGEFRNGIMHLVKETEHVGNNMKLYVEDFTRTFILVTFGQPTKNPALVYDEDDFNAEVGDIEGSDNTYSADNTDNELVDNTISAEKDTEKNKSNRKWVEVKIDDPLEWFWNIYDTFAANIYMLIICIIVLILGIAGVLSSFIYYKNRRKKR